MKYQFAEKSEHLWSDIHTIDADCLNPKILQMCSVCMQTRISREPLAEKHTYPGVYADGNTCLVCGEYQPSEGLEFRLSDDGTYELCGLGSFDGKILVIPSEYTGIVVSKIGSVDWNIGESIEKVFIPDTIEEINHYTLFNEMYNLKHIIVDKDNIYYRDIQEEGLYSKDGTKLIRYAPGRTGTFTIPECVTAITGNSAFDDCLLNKLIITDNVISSDCSFIMENNFTSIYIGASFTGHSYGSLIDGQIFNTNWDTMLTEINVSDDNEHYKSIDGILYSKDGSELICYPSGKIETEFVVPESVTSIGYAAFYHAKNLQKVTLPNSLFKIETHAFTQCYDLSEIYIPDSVIDIGDLAFISCYELNTIVIGKSIQNIGYHAFTDCVFDKVFYSGTPAEWNSIDIGEHNDSFQAVTRYYYNEDEPTTSGNYWHYVEGIPTIW